MFLIPNKFWQIKETKEKGRGVFAKKDIAPGRIIGDYIGKVINPFEENFYEKDKDLYLLYYSDLAAIYPDTKEEGIHLLNHSCAPNCFMYTYKGHTLIFALRLVFAGEELTISYLLPPQDSKSKIYTCKCESINCTKSMRLSQKKYTKWLKFHEAQMKNTKIAKFQYNKNLPLLPSYPKKISYRRYLLLHSFLQKAKLSSLSLQFSQQI